MAAGKLTATDAEKMLKVKGKAVPVTGHEGP
jgi:hypothetical protein